MKKGFTLLELIVVIIIIGILATLGFAQYARMIERSRGAEARQVIGSIRTAAAGLYMANNNQLPNPVAPLTFHDLLAMGTTAGTISTSCAAAGANSTLYYFSYAFVRNNADQITLTANRCVGGLGKLPSGTAPSLTAELVSNFTTGVDTWQGTGGY